jgi:hypothetical protein
MDTLLIAVALALGSMSAGVPQATSPDISGSWDLTVSTTSGLEVATLTLKKNGNAFSGTAARGTEQATVEAKVKDKAVTIVITAQGQSGPTTFTLTGEVEGDTMAGTGEFGTRGEGTWSAKRTGASGAADVSGTWAVVVDAGKASEKPTLMLKQDGEKLSGIYRGGQFGEAALKGTIKGTAIEFWIDLSVRGEGARVTYTGTVDKDTMKGTAKLGNLGEGTFKGTRKR